MNPSHPGESASRRLATLEPLALRVATVHGAHDGRLVTVHHHVVELRGMLEPGFEGVDESEARQVREHLAAIRSLTDGFSTPAWACNSYRTLLRELASLEPEAIALCAP